MNAIGSILAAPAALTTMYAERLLGGIAPETFSSFARPGGVVVKSNHPAFVFGHLGLYPVRVLDLLGKPNDAARYPTAWEALFKNGVECIDDPSGKHYPPMKELTEFFFRAQGAAVAALREARDEQLTAANPAEGRMKELFPTVGAALGFYVAAHAQQHLGQLSAWRRMMGLPAA